MSPSHQPSVTLVVQPQLEVDWWWIQIRAKANPAWWAFSMPSLSAPAAPATARAAHPFGV